MTFAPSPGAIATTQQARASNPHESVWVSASAGTGKTKVLVDRVLRLLLPRADSTPGTRPNRILCLTYTKAAAAEMTERLHTRLSAWSVMPEPDLIAQLEKLLGATPTSAHLAAARGLFTQLVDGPDRVRISTLHSFCQSVLARFPIEAGLPPHFSLIEESAVKTLQKEAEDITLRQLRADPIDALRLHRLYRAVDAGRISDVLAALLSDMRQLETALDQNLATQDRAELLTALQLPIDLTRDSWGDTLSHLPLRIADELPALAAAFGTGGKKDQELADKIAIFLSSKNRIADFDTLISAFFTSEGKPRANNATSGARKQNPDLVTLYDQMRDWVSAQWKIRDGLELVDLNTDLIKVARHMLDTYRDLKTARAIVDFNDLIRYTARLLTHTKDGHAVLPWVMYKLDGGIDHILVDEAQDTSPQQWSIIRALVAHFKSDTARERTLFVVGDTKQSIYSFQGADAESFQASLSILGAQIDMTTIDMNVSFRTTPPVLNMVDHVFTTDTAPAALRLQAPLLHIPNRIHEMGCVRVWPALPPPAVKDTNDSPWVVPKMDNDAHDSRLVLARQVAQSIRDKLDRGDLVPSTGERLRPRDIMVLVRKRQPFLPLILAELRRLKVPVSGLDRLRLLDSLGVQDIMALVQFALLPEDDLTLAVVLKSPFIGLNDDDLITLAPGRTGHLWDALQAHSTYRDIAFYLAMVQDWARGARADDFLALILDQPCPADMNGSGLRALQARLGPDVVDPLSILRLRARAASDEPGGLQAFLYALQKDDSDIKRDLNVRDDVVRLMTVHAAKGLEAPLVILPDTCLGPPSHNRVTIFWPEETGARLPIWIPSVGLRPDVFEEIVTRAETAATHEYQRLLYVALTRARDEVWVMGAHSARDRPSGWYDTICFGMDRLQDQAAYRVENDVRVFGDENIAGPAPDMSAPPLAPLPNWVGAPLRTEPAPSRPLRPERASAIAPVASPLQVITMPDMYHRGLLIHKLLQILPALPRGQAPHLIADFLNQYGIALTPAARDQVAHEVMAVLDHPDLHDVFGPGSQAEVPVTGQLPSGRLIAGQIDRLLVTPHKIVIVDYKTNLEVPRDMSGVPAAYLAQMRAYRDVMAQIYPGRRVECWLIWTTTAQVMPILDDTLDSAENHAGIRAAKTKGIG